MLNSKFFSKKNSLLLTLYISFVTSLLTYGLTYYIDQNYVTYFISQEIIEKNKKIIEFNQSAKYYNNLLAINENNLRPLNLACQSEKPLQNTLTCSTNDDTLILLSPVLHMLFPLLLTLYRCYTRVYSNFWLNLYICNTISVLIVLLLLDNTTFKAFANNTTYVLSSISIITVLYALYFYKSVSPYMNKKRQKKFTCTQKEINALLQRTDIEILN